MPPDLALAVALALASVGSAVIIGLALVALVRRRSWPYLLVTLALATLLARTAVGVGSLWGWFSVATHHTVEHALDVAMAGLVIAAVYLARGARRPVGGTEPEEGEALRDGGPEDGDALRDGGPEP